MATIIVVKANRKNFRREVQMSSLTVRLAARLTDVPESGRVREEALYEGYTRALGAVFLVAWLLIVSVVGSATFLAVDSLGWHPARGTVVTVVADGDPKSAMVRVTETDRREFVGAMVTVPGDHVRGETLRFALANDGGVAMVPAWKAASVTALLVGIVLLFVFTFLIAFSEDSPRYDARLEMRRMLEPRAVEAYEARLRNDYFR